MYGRSLNREDSALMRIKARMNVWSVDVLIASVSMLLRDALFGDVRPYRASSRFDDLFSCSRFCRHFFYIRPDSGGNHLPL